MQVVQSKWSKRDEKNGKEEEKESLVSSLPSKEYLWHLIPKLALGLA